MICTRWLALSTRQSSNSLSTCDWVSSLGTTERKTIFALRSNTTISVISFRLNGLVSGRRSTIPQPLAWEANALPIELLPQDPRANYESMKMSMEVTRGERTLRRWPAALGLWLTRRSNLDSQRPVSHDMRAHILQLIQTQKRTY